MSKKIAGKKIATWHNDGAPHGRFEWEPGEGPPPRPLWAPLFVIGICIAILFFQGAFARGAEPVPTFEVTNKVPPFTVTNRMAVAPAVVADPTEPAPAGFQWQRRGDEPWKLVAVGKEVSWPVATPKSGTPEWTTDSTRATTARTPTATPSSTRWTGSSGVVYTLTPVGVAGPLGTTADNCPIGQP